MFGFIIFLVVLSFIGRLFSRPYYGYYRPRIYPYGGFGSWGMGMGHHCGPVFRRGPFHHMGYHHHHHMGHGRRW